MDIKHSSAFSKCYIMQHEDIERFADTLADGFSKYNLFKYTCNNKYSHDKNEYILGCIHSSYCR